MCIFELSEEELDYEIETAAALLLILEFRILENIQNLLK